MIDRLDCPFVVCLLVHERTDKFEFAILDQADINMGLVTEYTHDDDGCAFAGIFHSLIDGWLGADAFKNQIGTVRTEGPGNGGVKIFHAGVDGVLDAASPGLFQLVLTDIGNHGSTGS